MTIDELKAELADLKSSEVWPKDKLEIESRIVKAFEELIQRAKITEKDLAKAVLFSKTCEDRDLYKDLYEKQLRGRQS